MCCINSETFSCREFFIRAMRYKIIGAGYRAYKDMRLDRTYIGAGTIRSGSTESYEQQAEDQRNRFERSLSILNALEREVRWPRTKTFVLKPTGHNLVPCTMFIGDRRWNRSPYLMSLFTLIIRAGHQVWMPDTVKGKTWAEIKPIIEKAARDGDGSKDRKWVTSGIKYWLPILANYKNIFGYQSRAWHWSMNRISNTSWMTQEGIYKLISGQTEFKDLYDKFKKIKREVDNNERKASKSGTAP